MKPIQFILVPLLAFLLVVFFVKLKRQHILKWVVSVIFCLGLFFSIYPDMTTTIAQFLGIGRGADLVMYLGMIGLLVVCLLLYLRLIRLERILTEIIRDRAINPED